MSLLSDIVSLFGSHHANPQPAGSNTHNPQANNQQVQQRAVPNLQPTFTPQGRGVANDRNEVPQPVTGGDFSPHFNAGPHSTISPGLAMLLRGFSNPQDNQFPGGAEFNNNSGGFPGLQGQTNPGEIPLQASHGRIGSTVGTQPAESPLFQLLHQTLAGRQPLQHLDASNGFPPAQKAQYKQPF